jgi:phosphonate transport system substrate-binding protein
MTSFNFKTSSQAHLATLTKIIPTIIIIFLSACNNESNESYTLKFTNSPPTQETEYIFGVHPLHNPQRLFEVFNPMMEYLSKNIKGVTFKLEASRNYPAFDKKLYDRKFDFALPNPFQTINAIDRGYKVFGKIGLDKNFRGIFIIRKDAQIKSVTDLIGKAVSYPAPSALAATMMPQYFLQENGIDAMKDIKNLYVGSQDSAIMNVYLKLTQAAGTWPPPWNEFKKQRPDIAKQLTIIWNTKPLVALGLVASPDIPQNIVKQVIYLLTTPEEHGQGIDLLWRSEFSGIVLPADNETYAIVRKFLVQFAKKVRPLE